MANGRRPDQSIPRRTSTADPSLARIGWFVRLGESDVRFVNARGDSWPSTSVTSSVSRWGFSDDGESYGLQPEVRDPVTGKVLIEADKCLYLLIAGQTFTPCVVGVLPGAGRSDVIPPDVTSDPARKASVALVRDQSTGTTQGSVRTVVNGGGVNVNIELRNAGGSVRTSVEATNDKVVVKVGTLTFTMQGSTVTVDAGGASLSLADERLCTRLASMMGELSAAAAAIPYVLSPSFTQNIAELAGKADTTTVLKAQ